MGNHLIEKYCQLDDAVKSKLRDICNFYSLSARSYYRLIKVSRTIADLEGAETIGESHVKRAAQFRLKN